MPPVAIVAASGDDGIVLPLSEFDKVVGDRTPVWTRDGRALIYVTADIDSSNLALMWPDGSGRVLFVNRFGDNSAPSPGPPVTP